MPTDLNIEISGITFASPPVVTFTVNNQDGRGDPDIAASQLSWTIAKLVPDGNTHTWRSYIRRVRNARPAAIEGGLDEPAMPSAIQSDAEAGTRGTLAYQGNGVYKYTFATDITNVTTPVPVTYEPTLTHRVALQVAVTCHNPEHIEPNSGESLDMAVLIHKLHRGVSLPRVSQGYRYLVWGFPNAPMQFDRVVYPFETRARHATIANAGMQCQKCHTDDAEWAAEFKSTPTADGGNWKNTFNKAACASCHEDVPGIGPAGAPWINPAKQNHVGLTEDDCRFCHLDTGFAKNPVQAHRLDAFERARAIKVSIGGAPEFDAEERIFSFRVKATDGDGGVQAPNITNVTVAGDPDAEGYYTVVRALNQAQVDAMVAAGGSGMLVLRGQVNDAGTPLYFPNPTAALSIDGSAAMARRTVVLAEDGCRNCHMGLSMHGAGTGYNDNVKTCAVCHGSGAAFDFRVAHGL